VRAFIKVSELTDEQAESLTRTLRAVEGVVDAEVFAEDRVASVLYDVRIDLPGLVAAIQGAGYDAQPL
jgi:copper chaperone CopZ